MSVRNATKDDIPDMRNILLTGLPSDVVWKYCFPQGRGGADKLIDDALHVWLDGSLTDANQWLVTVSEDRETGKPVSLAVWSLPRSAEDIEAGKGGDFVAFQDKLRHAADAAAAPSAADASSAARLAALAGAIQRATRSADGPLLGRFGPQMVLLLTATLPSHRYRGHARALVAHGLTLASRYHMAGSDGGAGGAGVPVSALAGPMGYIFFSGLRFSDRGPVTVRAPGEGAAAAADELDLKVMVQTPPPARRSFSQQLLGIFGVGGDASGSAAGGGSGRSSPAPSEDRGRRLSAFEERKKSSFEARKLSAA